MKMTEYVDFALSDLVFICQGLPQMPVFRSISISPLPTLTYLEVRNAGVPNVGGDVAPDLQLPDALCGHEQQVTGAGAR